MILKMAFRNIFRHKVRSILTLISLAVGILILIIGVGFNLGMERHIIKIMREVEIGDSKIYKAGFFKDKTENLDDRLDFMINEEIIPIVDKYKNSRRVVFQGTITANSYDYPVRVIGGDREKEEIMFDRSKYLIDGQLGVTIASKLAKNLNLSIGDEFVLKGITQKGSMNAKDFVITGIIKTGSFEFDTSTILIDKDKINDFTETKGFNDIAIDGKIEDNDIKQLEKMGVEVIGYKTELEDVLKITQIKMKVTFIFGAIILLMSGVGIINTMLMAMLERKKEIGILMANGIKPKLILKLFLLEGFLMGFIGSFSGFIIGGISLFYYQIVGIALPETADQLGTSIPLTDRIYGYFDWRINIMFLLFGIIIATLSSFYPAYKATKLEPIDVIWDR